MWRFASICVAVMPERLSASCLHMHFYIVDRHRLDILISYIHICDPNMHVVGSMSKISRLQVPHRDVREISPPGAVRGVLD